MSDRIDELQLGQMPTAFGTTFIPQPEHVCTSIDLMSNNEKNVRHRVGNDCLMGRGGKQRRRFTEGRRSKLLFHSVPSIACTGLIGAS